MKSKILLGSTLTILCGLVIPSVCQTALSADAASDLVINRLPMDLARGSVGTHLQVREPNGSVRDGAQALIADDASKSYSLPNGTTSVILSLAQIEVLSHFNFINNGAEGKMTISVSNTKLPFDSSSWKQAGVVDHFDGRRVVACELGSVEGRYVKIDFSTRNAGAIAAFGLFGMPVISGYRQQAISYVTTPTKTDVANAGEDRSAYYDYASLSMGSKVVAVSHADSLAAAQYMIDGNSETAFTFDPTDPNPTAVIDLGTRRSIDRVSCVFEAPAGQLDFYLVENTYSKNDTQVSLNYVTPPGMQPVTNTETLNYSGTELLASRKPVGSIQTTGESGTNRVSVNLNGLTGRFLIAAFHRTGSSHASGHDSKDSVADGKYFKDKNVAVADNPVKVAGISAFGEPPTAESIPLLPPLSGRAIQGARPPSAPPNDTDASR